MRRVLLGSLLALSLASLVPGCGGASGIQEGVPADAQPPPNFDPGGDSKPDMSGRKVAPKK